jgi:hypothetical protein
MRAAVDIDEGKLKQLLAASGAANTEEALSRAVDEYLRRLAATSLLRLEGKVEFDLDWRQLEQREEARDDDRG